MEETRAASTGLDMVTPGRSVAPEVVPEVAPEVAPFEGVASECGRRSGARDLVGERLEALEESAEEEEEE